MRMLKNRVEIFDLAKLELDLTLIYDLCKSEVTLSSGKCTIINQINQKSIQN